MATYPDDPNLPAVSTTTAVDPDFLNTFTDNINAIGADLAVLSDNAGNIDLAIDKGIAWATTLEIYKSGGDLVIDDNVGITGNLDITGTISGASLSVLGSLDIPGTLTVDIINDSGAAQITINETIEMGAGKGLRGDGSSALLLPNGCNITGNLDVTGTLSVDTINDSGAAHITVNEDMEFAAGKYIDAPTGKFGQLYDSGGGKIYVRNDLQLLGGEARLELTVDSGTPDNPITSMAIIWLDSSSDLKIKMR